MTKNGNFSLSGKFTGAYFNIAGVGSVGVQASKEAPADEGRLRKAVEAARDEFWRVYLAKTARNKSATEPKNYEK